MLWSKNPSEELEKKEQLFFHDLINQTHGLILFLSQRKKNKQLINIEEIEMLEHEIRTLQSIIKDHFHFKHKNLASSYDFVTFAEAQTVLYHLIDMYLPKESVQTFIYLKGDLSEVNSLNNRLKILIYYPSFYRIMNNLIKNMAEAKTCEVTFIFTYQNKELGIETRNKINSKSNTQNIPDRPAREISDNANSQNKNLGLGLESVDFQAKSCKGRFEFEINNDVWINRIFLPQDQLPKTADKKAA